MKKKFLSIFIALVLVLSFSLVTAVPVGAADPETVLLGGDVAVAVGAQGSDEYYTGTGSWAAVSGDSTATGKMELYIDPTVAPFDSLGTFTIDAIDSISYQTNKPGAQGDPDFYLVIYTVPDGVDDDSSWYGYRLNAEPLYSNGLGAPANDWNQWNTGGATNQLTFFDSNRTVAGFYNGPTLVDLQAGSINWGDYPTSGSMDIIDYGAETVKYITFQTGTPWCGTFEGNIDAITISLTGGASVTIDLEEYYNEVWADDDATEAWYALPGNFASIQDGIDNVAEDGTVIVAAGPYTETLVVDKQLTLQGAGSASTIIDATGEVHGILLTAGGVSASQRLSIKGLTVKNANSNGIRAYKAGGFSLNHVTLEDVVLTLNGATGMEIHNDTTVSDMEIKGCKFVSNDHIGLRTASNVIVDGMAITDSKFNGNTYGIYLQGTINGVTILRSFFNGNIGASDGSHGAYMTETGPLTNLLIEDSEFKNNSGCGLMVWNEQDNADITIRRTLFQDNKKWGALIWGNTLTDVLIEDSTVLNNDGLGEGYYGIDFNTYDEAMTNVAVHFTSITGHIVGGGVKNRNTVATAIVDATNNWWGNAIESQIAKLVSGNVDYSPWLDAAGGEPTFVDVTAIGLKSGWNLISLPLIPEAEASNIETVLAGVNVIKVAYYTGDPEGPEGGWLYYNGDPETSDLTQMQDGKGYWIDVSTAGALTIRGYELCAPPPAVPPSYDLVEGWNLIGFKSLATDTDVATYLGTAVTDTMEAMYGFDAAAGLYTIILDATDLVAGQGYWLAVSADGTIYP